MGSVMLLTWNVAFLPNQRWQRDDRDHGGGFVVTCIKETVVVGVLKYGCNGVVPRYFASSWLAGGAVLVLASTSATSKGGSNRSTATTSTLAFISQLHPGYLLYCTYLP